MPTTMTPLRYPGGKTKFYAYVRKILESNNLIGQTYIEPFAGGAGLAIKLLLNGDVKRIVINDLDPAIYAFWFSILNKTEEFCSLIESTRICTDEWHVQKEVYLEHDLNDIVRLGFATFFLNRTNVSGVIKGGIIGGYSQEGTFPIYARFNKKGLISKINNISQFKDKILVTNLDVKQFLKVDNLRQYYKALINMDPPYVKKGAQLYKNSFTEEDHRALANIIANCNRKWIVTYDVCPLIAELYQSYRSSYLDVTYTVQGTTKSKEFIYFSDNLKIPSEIALHNNADCDLKKNVNSSLKLITV